MNATFLKSNILSVLILSLMLSGCMAYQPAINSVPPILNGDVLGTNGGTAKFIVDQALNDVSGSSVWFHGDNYLFVAPVADNVGFVALNAGGKGPIDICSGNVASCQTVTGLLSYLASLGWRRLAVLPEYTVTLMQDMAGSLVTPVIMLPSPYSPFGEGIKQ